MAHSLEFGPPLRLILSSINAQPTVPDMAFYDRIRVLPCPAEFIRPFIFKPAMPPAPRYRMQVG